jgi:hypothetical protein
MMMLSAEDLADLRRWAICGAIVVVAHGAVAAGMVNWREEIEPAEPAAAIVIEFAPVPVGPAAPQTEIAPGPEQVMSEASPERPVEQVEEKQKIEEILPSDFRTSGKFLWCNLRGWCDFRRRDFREFGQFLWRDL